MAVWYVSSQAVWHIIHYLSLLSDLPSLVSWFRYRHVGHSFPYIYLQLVWTNFDNSLTYYLGAAFYFLCLLPILLFENLYLYKIYDIAGFSLSFC